MAIGVSKQLTNKTQGWLLIILLMKSSMTTIYYFYV